MHPKHLAVVLGAVTAVMVVGVAPASTIADTAGTTSSSTAPAARTSTALLESSTPKTVVLDPSTGVVLSVTLGEPVDLATPDPDISGGTDCAAGDGCYYTPTVNGTYHDRSFYGSPGTFTGSWPRRNAWDSGNYTASVCWDGGCSNTVGPNTYATFGGSLVTGTSFTIY